MSPPWAIGSRCRDSEGSGAMVIHAFPQERLIFGLVKEHLNGRNGRRKVAIDAAPFKRETKCLARAFRIS
jgi:hypothetical protein